MKLGGCSLLLLIAVSVAIGLFRIPTTLVSADRSSYPTTSTASHGGCPYEASSTNFSVQDRYICWLRSDTHFIWAFISPVIVIIIANIGFCIMAISIMWKHQNRFRVKSHLKNARHWLKTVISLMVIMGITWIIGVLVFQKALLFVTYIFVIATAFQIANNTICWTLVKQSAPQGCLHLLLFVVIVQTAAVAVAVAVLLTNMQMVDHSKDVSNFKRSTDIDYGSHIQILDYNGEVCTFEGVTEMIEKKIQKTGIYQQSSTEDMDSCTIMENQMTSD